MRAGDGKGVGNRNIAKGKKETSETTLQVKARIAVLPGDGIGPEVVAQALKVLEAVGQIHQLDFEITHYPFGGAGIDTCGEAFPLATKEGCLASDAVLLGAVGGPKWDGLKGSQRPEKALLSLRETLGVFANLRPAKLFPSLIEACPLKSVSQDNGFDLCVVRELTGGIYFGEKGRDHHPALGEIAYDIEKYSRMEIQRIAIKAFELARTRRFQVTSVDKANVLESSRLWREVVEEVAKDYTDVALSHMYVDNAAMQLIHNPGQFDVILTSNLFGDILSDEASMLTGSIGMLPSASMGHQHTDTSSPDSSDTDPMAIGLYEPIHGSAPDIAGQDKANPLATILSIAMMLKLQFGHDLAARGIEDAVEAVLEAGYRTGDLLCLTAESSQSKGFLQSPPTKLVSTSQMGNLVIEFLHKKSGRG